MSPYPGLSSNRLTSNSRGPVPWRPHAWMIRPSFGSITVTDGFVSRTYRRPSGPASIPSGMASFVADQENALTTVNGSGRADADGAGRADDDAAGDGKRPINARSA